MPVYEYECEKCGSSFERIVFQGDKEEISCPECNETNVKKLISSAGFIKSGFLGQSSGNSSCGTKSLGGFS
jgi:putative FmdB family regulatory protein